MIDQGRAIWEQDKHHWPDGTILASPPYRTVPRMETMHESAKAAREVPEEPEGVVVLLRQHECLLEARRTK